MGILDTAGRELVKRVTAKAIAKTDTGKKITKFLTKKPQTPKGEGLSFGGNTLQTTQSQKNEFAEQDKQFNTIQSIRNYSGDNDEIAKAARSYSTKDIADEDSWFNLTSSVFNKGVTSTDSNKTRDFLDGLIGTTKGDKSSEKLIKSKLSTDTFEDFKFYRRKVTEASGNLSSQEGRFDAFTTGQAQGIPFASPVVDTLSKGASYLGGWIAEGSMGAERLPSFKEREQAKMEKAMNDEYKMRTGYRIAGAAQGSLTGYGVLGKVFDKALLSTKVPTMAKPIQDALRQSYATNPTLFNITSNSAQEVIEYGIRKGVGDDDYSLKDFALGLLVGGIASKVFSKKVDSIFGNITQKDTLKIDTKINDFMKINPEASYKEAMDAIGDTKLDGGLTLGELKESFIKGNGGKLREVVETTPEAMESFIRSAGSNITSGGSKRLAETMNYINSKLPSWNSKPPSLTNVNDISLLKQDIISDIASLGKAGYKDVDNIIAKRSAEYGVSIKSSKGNFDIYDDVEEVINKGVSLDNLANPRTLNGFKQSYLGKADENMDGIYKLQEDIEKTNVGKQTDIRAAKRVELQKKLDGIVKKAGYKSVDDFENTRYRINNENVKVLAKQSRATTGRKGKITIAELSDARSKIVEDTKATEAKLDKLIEKMGKVVSKDKDGAFEKAIQFTQLKKGIDDNEYLSAMKSFIDVNEKLLKEGKTWQSIKDARVSKMVEDINAIQSEAALKTDGKFELFKGDAADASFAKKVYRTLTFREGGLLSYMDSYKRVFDRMLGEGTQTKRVLYDDIVSSEGEYLNHKIGFLGNMNKQLRGLITSPQETHELMIAGYARAGLYDHIKNAANLSIMDGKIYNTRFPPMVDGSKISRALNDDDINAILKKYNQPKYKNFWQSLDNEFHNNATEFNRMMYDDKGKLIDINRKYFPVNYMDAEYRPGDESTDTLKQMFSRHIDQGFLNARKSVPGYFELDMDIESVLRKYTDRQIYFLHMKSPVMKAKRAISGARLTNNASEIADDFDISPEGVITLKEIDMEELSPLFSPRAKSYYKKFIDRIEAQGKIPNSNVPVARWYSGISTYATIAGNMFSVLAQPLSKIDSIANTSFKNWAISTGIAVKESIKRGGNRSAMEYSGWLRARQTEHVSGLALGKFKQADLSDFNLKEFRDMPLEKINEVLLRPMRRIDGEVSSSVWYGYLLDYRDKYSPNAKGYDVETLRKNMTPEEFDAAIRYADREAASVMGGSTLISTGARIEEMGAAYKIGTAIQKTFINRMLFLNDVINKGGINNVSSVILTLGLVEWAEYEREYVRQKYYAGTGRKEFKEGVEFNFMGMKLGGKDTHIGNMLANNPSLQFDSQLGKTIKAINPNLSEGEVLGARAFIRFVSNNVWHPGSGYEVSSMTSGLSKIVEKSAKGELPPKNRLEIQLAENVAKMMAFSMGDDAINVLHGFLLDETFWQTEDDNYQLGKVSKSNPELKEDLESKTFKEQGEFAKQKATEYETTKKIQEESSRKNGVKENIRQLIYKKYGYTPSKAQLVEFMNANKNLAIESGIMGASKDEYISNLKSFHSTLNAEDLNKSRVSSYQPYFTKSAEFFITDEGEHGLKKYIDNRDMEGLKAKISELESVGVIMDRKSFEKNLVKSMRNKGYVK